MKILLSILSTYIIRSYFNYVKLILFFNNGWFYNDNIVFLIIELTFNNIFLEPY